jgi:hypothetical protein
MIDPDHLLDLAESEVNAQGPGAPRQTELCRAVSSTYYALFHSLSQRIMWTFAPKFAPKAGALFYRALDHRKTYDRCKRLGQYPLPRDEKNFFRFDAFPPEIRHFANEFVRLQELRERADYNSEFKVTKASVREIIDAARLAKAGLDSADNMARALFLSYLLFGLRG